MYGFDGNISALEWADQFGFSTLQENDQQKLIKSGHYTSEGHRIYSPEEKCPPSSTSIRIHLDIRM